MPRKIEGLYFVSRLSERPRNIPKPSRLTGSRAAGIAYEKKVIRTLKRRFPTADLKYHEWLQFADKNGGGYAEPEAYIVLKEFVFLLECKRTGGLAGKLQVTELYAPLLERVYERPVRSLLICKYVTESTPGPFVQSVEEFLMGSMPFATWHWLPEP